MNNLVIPTEIIIFAPKKYELMSENKDNNQVLKKQTNWSTLFIYQKSEVIYHLSFSFCNRFIHLYKDRTRDQVIQAARSCKQNIVEGLEDGVTSSEMQLKLLNVARASLMELREDFTDYLKSRHLRIYEKKDIEYAPIVNYCRYHNNLEEYEPFFESWTDEVMGNYALSLCHIIDKMLMSFLEKLEKEFINEGGIKERMYRARTGHLNKQDERIKQQDERIRNLETENARLNTSLSEANSKVVAWAESYNNLKERALKAYYSQKDEIESLKAEIKRLKEAKSTGDI